MPSRLLAAASVALAVSFLLGKSLIPHLRRRCGERVLMDSPPLAALHRPKQGTPTMGGLFVLAAILAAMAAAGGVPGVETSLALVSIAGFGAIGFWDDWIKVSGRGRGLSPAVKLSAQVAWSITAGGLLHWFAPHVLHPLAGGTDGLTHFVAVLWYALILSAASNSVNLTDGLDGLAGGAAFILTSALAVAAWWTGHEQSALLSATAAGALLAFLWFNCHPAQVFLGNVGSLALGALLGHVAVASRQELLLFVGGGLFVFEAASVAIQVASWKLRGKRVFRCAPIHHHFQLLGWHEGAIVVRFWLIALVLAGAGLLLTSPSGRSSINGPLDSQAAAAVHRAR